VNSTFARTFRARTHAARDAAERFETEARWRGTIREFGEGEEGRGGKKTRLQPAFRRSRRDMGCDSTKRSRCRGASFERPTASVSSRAWFHRHISRRRRGASSPRKDAHRRMLCGSAYAFATTHNPILAGPHGFGHLANLDFDESLSGVSLRTATRRQFPFASAARAPSPAPSTSSSRATRGWPSRPLPSASMLHDGTTSQGC